MLSSKLSTTTLREVAQLMASFHWVQRISVRGISSCKPRGLLPANAPLFLHECGRMARLVATLGCTVAVGSWQCRATCQMHLIRAQAPGLLNGAILHLLAVVYTWQGQSSAFFKILVPDDVSI